MAQAIDSEALRAHIEATVAVFSVEELERELAARRTIPDEASRDLACFVREVWSIIEPGCPFQPNWHVALICEYLEAVSAGQINRLIINVPPRYGKSLIVTVLWPVWEWISHPELRYLFCSYSASLSVKHSLDRRRVLESDWYRARYPQVALVSDQNEKTEYENSARGVMFATSVGGTVTGKGGNRIIVDDPINPAQASSETERNSANSFFDQTLSTRLDDKKHNPIVIVGQRVHLDDLCGHVLERSGESWTVVKLPATEERRTVVYFPRSGRKSSGSRVCPSGRPVRVRSSWPALGASWEAPPMPPSTSRTRRPPRGR